MLYLAQVIRRNLKLRTSLKLLAAQKGDYLWAKIESHVFDTEDTASFSDRDLVLVEISANRKILKVLDAALELPTILDNLSKRTLSAENRCKEQEDEWQLRTESLRIQSHELSVRRDELDARDEQLTQSLSRVRDWETKLQQARAKLQSEWETLREREAKLDARSLAE